MTSPLLRRFLVLPTATSLVLTGLTPALAGDADSACPASQTPGAGFGDTAGTAHEANIDCVAFWGIARGTSSTTYSPALPVSRAQLATFLARTISEARALPAAVDRGFEDVRGTAHEDRINQLAALEVVNGIAGGAFGPDLNVSRGQMATFLVRAWEAATGVALERQGTRRFADTDGTAHADNADIAFEMGWSTGDGGGNFNPGAPVSRGAMASFLARFLEDLAAQGHIGAPGDPRLQAFEVSDADSDNALGAGDSLTLAYNKAMQANSSITLRDGDGDETIVDDEATAGVVDGRTAATLSGNGTDTLVFTLTEAPDVTGSGNGVLDGTIAIVAQSGIASTSGASWEPAQDPEEATTEPVGDGTGTTPPATGGGGGGGGSTPPASGDTVAPEAPTLSFVSPDSEQEAARFNAKTAQRAMLRGAAEAGSAVTVIVEDAKGATRSATGTASDKGTFEVVVNLATLADGELTATATAADAARNVSPSSAEATALLDATLPAGTTMSFDVQMVNRANEAAVPISGKAEPGTTVHVNVEGAGDGEFLSPTVTQQPTQQNGGVWSAELDLTGTHPVGEVWGYAVATDAFGNHGASEPTTVARDAKAPAAPTVVFAKEAFAASDLGAISLTGTAEVGSVVDVVLTDEADGREDLQVTAGENGLWDVTATGPFQTGVLTATATSTDAAGNTGEAAVATASLDATAPGFTTGGLTNATKVVFLADEDLDVETVDTSAPANEDIATSFSRRTEPDGAPPVEENTPAIAQVEVLDGRRIEVTFAGPLPDGERVWLRAGAVTDVLGNAIAADVVHEIATLPAPGITEPVVVNAASVATWPVSGTGKPGTRVVVTVAEVDSQTGLATDRAVSSSELAVDEAGAWSGAIDLSGLADGPLAVTAVATNGIDESDETEPVSTTKDTVAPAMTSAAAASGDATAAITLSEAIDLATIEAADVEVGAGQPAVDKVTWASSTQTLTIHFVGKLKGSIDIGLAAEAFLDLAGNPTPAISHTVSAAPVPTITSAPEHIGGPTVEATPVTDVDLAGTAQPGSAVTLTITDEQGVAVPFKAQASEAGTWTLEGLDLSATFTEGQFSEGDLVVTVEADNGADVIPGVEAATMHLDVTAPEVPASAAFTGERFSDLSAVPLRGEAEPGSTVTVTVYDEHGDSPETGPAPSAPDPTPAVTATAVTNEAGIWSLDADLSGWKLPDSPNDHAILAVAMATDAAGNASSETAAVDAMLDLKAPTVQPGATPQEVEGAWVYTFTVSEDIDPTTLDTVTPEATDFVLTTDLSDASIAEVRLTGLKIEVVLTAALYSGETLEMTAGAVSDVSGNATRNAATHPGSKARPTPDAPVDPTA